MFALLAGLDEDFGYGALLGLAPFLTTGDGVELTSLIPAARPAFMVAEPQPARPPIVAHEYIIEEEVDYPPLRLRSVRDARKSSAMRLGVLFGGAVIVYS